MKLPYQSNMNRHLRKLASVIRVPLTKSMEQKIHKNHRSFQSSISSLYRQSISLLKQEKQARLTRMRIDKIRRRAEQAMHNFSHSMIHRQQDVDETIDVVDDENSEMIVTQDDLDGEEQLERLDNMVSLDSGIESFEKSSVGLLKQHSAETRPRNDDHSTDPLDLSYSSFVNQRAKINISPKPSHDFNISPQRTNNQFEAGNLRGNNIVTSTPIINNLPSRRSADDHLEQFMMVDPNQNIKWKQLADKFNKELGPNVCGVCHKTLSCKSALTMHYRVHTEERPFVCKVCEKRFSTKGNLKTHLGQHADVTDQYCMGSSINSSQFKPGNLMVPPSAMSSPTNINPHHQRMPLHHAGFPFPMPGLAANPHMFLNMFNNNNNIPNPDFNLIEAMKASQKLPVSDINSNFIIKSDDGNVPYPCNFCRQNFPSKLTLEIHIRNHNCAKDVFNAIQNGKFPNHWKERLLSNHQTIKQEGDTGSNHNTDDNESGNDGKVHSQEKFSLTTIMGLHNHPASLFSFLNNTSLLHRQMMPPFPGFAPSLLTSHHSGMPRMPMVTTTNNNFGYNYADIEGNHK